MLTENASAILSSECWVSMGIWMKPATSSLDEALLWMKLYYGCCSAMDEALLWMKHSPISIATPGKDHRCIVRGLVMFASLWWSCGFSRIRFIFGLFGRGIHSRYLQRVFRLNVQPLPRKLLTYTCRCCALQVQPNVHYASRSVLLHSNISHTVRSLHGY